MSTTSSPRKKPAKKAPAKKAAAPRRRRAAAVSAPAPAIPEPARPLATHGRALWDQVWARGQVRGNAEAFLIVCEQLDERNALRLRVFKDNDHHDRAGLRALEAAIVAGLTALGLGPVMPDQGDAPDDWTTRAGA